MQRHASEHFTLSRWLSSPTLIRLGVGGFSDPAGWGAMAIQDSQQGTVAEPERGSGLRLAVMQPYLFPYMGYFQLVHAVDRFVIYDDVNFIKQGWINRNNILVNGTTHRFAIPINGLSSFTAINEVLIDERLYGTWRSKFMKTLAQAYSKAPQYKETIVLVDHVLDPAASHIGQLALGSIKAVALHLGIDSTIVPSSSKYNNTDLKAQERILDICRLEGASHYVNAQGGSSLYDRTVFSAHGYKLSFLQPGLPAYQQGSASFVPGLSIIDVLMFNAPDRVRSMLNEFELS